MKVTTNSIPVWLFSTVLFAILFSIYWVLCLVRFPFIGVCLGIDRVNAYMWECYGRVCGYLGGFNKEEK
jgi:hypothetical protein